MSLRWLPRLLPFLRAGGAPVPVVLYTRAGCGLCEEMKAAMEAGAPGAYALREVDVDQDRDLKKRYGLRVPVLEIGGQERFEGRLAPEDFRRALSAARSST